MEIRGHIAAILCDETRSKSLGPHAGRTVNSSKLWTNLRVSRTVPDEMLPYIYSQNEFLSEDNSNYLVKGLIARTRAVRKVNSSHIEMLCIISGGDPEAYVADFYKKELSMPCSGLLANKSWWFNKI